MVNRYSNEDQFRKFLHMTACIAFIPQEDVLEAWNIMENIAIEKFENDEMIVLYPLPTMICVCHHIEIHHFHAHI